MFSHTTLADLPNKTLMRITLFLNPKEDIRALRYLIRATRNSVVHALATYATEILFIQKKELEDALFWSTIGDQQAGYERNDAAIHCWIGKQYVCEAEDINDDRWAFKKSQLPGSVKAMKSNSSISTLAVYEKKTRSAQVSPYPLSGLKTTEDKTANETTEPAAQDAGEAVPINPICCQRVDGRDYPMECGDICEKLWWIQMDR